MGKFARPWTVPTQYELAEALGVTRQCIGKWKRAGLKQLPDGQGWDVEAAKSWQKRHQGQRRTKKAHQIAQADIDELDAEMLRDFEELGDLKGLGLDEAAIRAQTRFRIIKSQRESIGLAKDRRDLVDRAEMELEWAQWGSALRQRMLDLGMRMSQELVGLEDPRQVQSIVDGHIRSVLDDIANTGEIEAKAG